MITKKSSFLIFILSITVVIVNAQTPDAWWKRNNLRVIQANLPDYKADTLNPDTLVNTLVSYHANTLLINAGGIMAFYPTKLSFQYTNPYLKNNNILAKVISLCHLHHIRVIVRFDFSRVHESIFKAHPDWCYLSPKGERIINTDMYAVSVNAPYVQQCAFKIISEVLDNFPVDGIFLNMPGYQVSNAYEGKYLGIDQNEYDKKRFAEYSHGLNLPTEENRTDPTFQKYLEFKKFTSEDWSKRLYDLVKAQNPQIAICTYTDKYVDIIRHEAQANSGLPYWPYIASDNVNNASHSYPDHIVSNASIQQISFQSRFNAVEPQEVAIRLYENIANGSGLDISLMGDMQNYEDERNYEVVRKIYGLHQQHEAYFGKYTSVAKIALIAPGLWPAGPAMQEYRGIQLILKEAHIPFDVISDVAIENQQAAIKSYKVVILPDINFLSPASIKILKEALANGTSLIATNTALYDSPEALNDLFGAKITNKDNDGAGNYLGIDNRTLFKHFALQKMLMLKYNLGLYDLSAADQRYLPILSKGRPGPPEIIGGHEPTGYYALAIKKTGTGLGALMPFNIGRLYYQNGYQEHKQLFLDVLNHIYPQATQTLLTDAHEKVETVLQQYTKNTGASGDKTDGLILHLINLTGFSGATYFTPLPLYNTHFKIRSFFRPVQVYLLTSHQPLPFTWRDGYVNFTLRELTDYQAVVMDK